MSTSRYRPSGATEVLEVGIRNVVVAERRGSTSSWWPSSLSRCDSSLPKVKCADVAEAVTKRQVQKKNKY